MTSIERTAYPRLTQYLPVQELEAVYTPDDDSLILLPFLGVQTHHV